MRPSDRTGQRLIAVFAAGLILLNYPLLFLFTRRSVGGVPLLYAYVFGIWMALIVLMAYATERSRG
jgi:hypothetical protein